MKGPNTNQKLMAALKVFRAVDPEIQLLYAMVFLEVAAREPCPMVDLPEKFGVTRATISRAHVYLSSYTIKTTVDKRHGHGLIRSEHNPENRRNLDLFLTAKGRTVYEQVIAALERK